MACASLDAALSAAGVLAAVALVSEATVVAVELRAAESAAIAESCWALAKKAMPHTNERNKDIPNFFIFVWSKCLVVGATYHVVA